MGDAFWGKEEPDWMDLDELPIADVAVLDEDVAMEDA